MMLKKIFLGFLALTVVLGGGAFLYGSFQKQDIVSPLVGRQVPSFSLNTFESLQAFHQGNLEGKPSLLTFFGSWCFSCRIEHKMLGNISRKYGIPLYGIALRDKEESLKEWLTKFGNPYTLIGLDYTGEVAREFEILGVPETFLIDEKGVIQYSVQGALISDDAIEGLERALSKMGLAPEKKEK